MCTKGKTWQLKNKEYLNDVQMEELKKMYLKVPLFKIAETINVDYNRIRYVTRQLKLPKYKSGKSSKTNEDKIVQVVVGVKSKHYSAAEKEIKELIKKYR